MLIDEVLSTSDETCMEIMQALMRERVKLGVMYTRDEEDEELLTHSFLVIYVGELQAASSPERLSVPFIPVLGNDNEPRVIN